MSIIMLKIRLATILSIFFMLAVTTQAKAQEATSEHKDSLNALVEEYYRLNVKVFQAGSTMADIDQIFSLFSEEFVYVHPKYGGTYSRQVLYDGYVRNQKNGGYDGSVVDIKIVRRIVGLNAVVAEKVFVQKEEGANIDGPPQMTLFEFKAGKIVRIMEYW